MGPPSEGTWLTGPHRMIARADAQAKLRVRHDEITRQAKIATALRQRASTYSRGAQLDRQLEHLKREEAGYNADLRIFQKHLQWFTQQRAFKQGREYALETQPKMQQEADDELFSKSFEEVLRETKLEGATPPER